MNRKDLGTLIVCSLRYCFGRCSYMPSDVVAIAKKNWGDLDKEDKLVIQRDLRETIATRNMGHDCDVVMWNNFAKWIEETEGVKNENIDLECAKFLEATGIRRPE